MASFRGAPFEISMVLEGEIHIDRVLGGIEQRAKDVRPAWPAVVKTFQSIVRQAFSSEGKSTGAAWQPLAASTVADRKRHGFGARPILARTHRLERALTTGSDANVAGRPQSLTYQLAPEVGYFRYHQSAGPRTKLPRRPPVLLTADQRHALMVPLRLYLTGRTPDQSRAGGTRRSEWRDVGGE